MRALEPLVVDNLLEELERLLQAVLRLVLVEHLIKLGERRDKDDGVESARGQDASEEQEQAQAARHGGARATVTP